MRGDGQPSGGEVVEVLTGGEVDALGAEWDALALRTGATPYDRPGWIGAWWSAFGHGELCVLTRRRDGRLTAVLPFGRSGSRLHSCSNVHSPVFDGVAESGDDLDALLEAALREGRAGVLFEAVDGAGELAAAIERQARRGARRLEFRSAVSSRIEPAASWEGFEGGLRRKRASDLRRSRKLLAKRGEVRFGHADPGEGIDARVEDFIRLEATEWRLRQGTAIEQSASATAFYRDVVSWAATAGILSLSFIWVDERPISSMLTLDDGRRRWALKTGFDGELSRASPGVIQLMEDIRVAIELGRTLELGLGEEPLKLELRTDSWPLLGIGLYPRSARGGAARAAAALRTGVRRRARESTVLRRARDTARGWLARVRGA